MAFRTDPRFETYNSSGYVYRSTSDTLLLKSRHKSEIENITMGYKTASVKPAASTTTATSAAASSTQSTEAASQPATTPTATTMITPAPETTPAAPAPASVEPAAN